MLDTKKMRACAPLLPEPGDKVVCDCLDEIDRLRAALADTLYFVERHSNRWDGINGKHPNDVVTAARELLGPNASLTGSGEGK